MPSRILPSRRVFFFALPHLLPSMIVLGMSLLCSIQRLLMSMSDLWTQRVSAQTVSSKWTQAIVGWNTVPLLSKWLHSNFRHPNALLVSDMISPPGHSQLTRCLFSTASLSPSPTDSGASTPTILCPTIVTAFTAGLPTTYEFAPAPTTVPSTPTGLTYTMSDVYYPCDPPLVTTTAILTTMSFISASY